MGVAHNFHSCPLGHTSASQALHAHQRCDKREFDMGTVVFCLRGRLFSIEGIGYTCKCALTALLCIVIMKA